MIAAHLGDDLGDALSVDFMGVLVPGRPGRTPWQDALAAL